MDRLGVALLGCGEGARRHHLPILARLPEVELVALADADPARLESARAHAPHAQTYADWREALGARGVEAAVVCLPSAQHANAAVAAFERGLHAYVEKPLALTVAEAERVVAACARAGVVGTTGLNYRFNALYASARRLLAAGRIGEPAAARSVFTTSARGLPGWKRVRAEGGGALLDLGSHHADLAAWLLGSPVVAVHASIGSRATEDDTASVELRLASGLVVQSLFAFGTVAEERFEVYGATARLVVDRARHQRALVEQLAPRSRALASLARAGGDLRHAAYVLEKRRTPGHEPSHLAALRAFAAAARGAAPVAPGLADGLAAVAVVEAAERSALSGRIEPVAAARLAIATTADAARG